MLKIYCFSGIAFVTILGIHGQAKVNMFYFKKCLMNKITLVFNDVIGMINEWDIVRPNFQKAFGKGSPKDWNVS